MIWNFIWFDSRPGSSVGFVAPRDGTVSVDVPVEVTGLVFVTGLVDVLEVLDVTGFVDVMGWVGSVSVEVTVLVIPVPGRLPVPPFDPLLEVGPGYGLVVPFALFEELQAASTSPNNKIMDPNI